MIMADEDRSEHQVSYALGNYDPAVKAALQAEGITTYSAARAWLDATVTVPNTERIDTAKIMARMSEDDARAVLGRLKNVAQTDVLVEEAFRQLQSEIGLDLSHPNARSMIGKLFVDDPALAARVQALGEKQVPRWESLGFGRRPKDGPLLSALGLPPYLNQAQE